MTVEKKQRECLTRELEGKRITMEEFQNSIAVGVIARAKQENGHT